ncbi:PhzF family phenazine biosynthesis protein [Paracidovorax valerianellae]|uniref:Phenazine biosynthesis protein PhzF family n=1 Tax=Paracidovorax valerianellae TaxID=187868 RepID=A0A1G7CYC2_9BURK|nr:PhzF family phenazine biosynthesis protein [Paracidovorax valerianellae]MDA8446328.1 PhzF family phenazine biosynthesis protein [Paracidovorax valerianellae]SDE44233.1 phenazine biosynthesis protein PhzF family [Paracidovorax valerianellae]
MRQRPFKQVDVFTQRPYLGNPLAVVLDGSGLSTEAMQHFTNWTNLSEATFLLPPTEAGRAAGADYRVRIFCPGRELPFAGHPTLGSCHAWLEAGGQPQTEGVVVQECALGLITLRRDGDRLAFAAPPLLKSGPLAEEDVALIARGLRIERSDIVAHAWCDNGPNWRGVMLGSAEQVLALQPDSAILSKLDIGVVGPRGKVGVVGAHADEDIAFEVRAFFPGNNGLAEDPVTGSLNAALAQWLIGAHLAPTSYIASQGTALGRAGRVHVQQDGDRIWIGGGSVTCVDGEVLL